MIVVSTPLRLSFFGGGTDFPDYYNLQGGLVVSTAIDKFVFVIVKERFDDKIYVNYSQKEIVDRIADLNHELVREAMAITGVEQGVEITTLADVPSSGTGLGSSSSVTVGVLQALYTYCGRIVEAESLARQACEIEIERCKKPIGKQDQYIAAYGGMRRFRFLPNGVVEAEDIGLSSSSAQRLNRNLMLFYTNTTRSASVVLAEQQNNIPDRLAFLDALQDIAERGAACLRKGNWDEFGRLLHENWELKKNLASGITNSQIDALYEAARRAGAMGGKIAGAGGGGFLLLYCPLDKQDAVREVLGHLRELPFAFERDGSKVIFNIRR
jgi:D-glycero-alpha-D-manno-heptose-7-phosphate kinase